MADISKCVNETCSLKDTCYRYTAPKSLYWQSYLNGEWKEEDGVVTCDFYWDNAKYSKDDKL